MNINEYKIRSGRVIGEEKNEQGFNVVYNVVDLMQGIIIPAGYTRIEDYPIFSGRIISEEKDSA